jgi:hypothetical protein
MGFITLCLHMGETGRMCTDDSIQYIQVERTCQRSGCLSSKRYTKDKIFKLRLMRRTEFSDSVNFSKITGCVCAKDFQIRCARSKTFFEL